MTSCIIKIHNEDIEKITYISNFVPSIKASFEYVVALNIFADLLIKRLKKLFHLILSEIAAPIYNKMYGATKIATSATMRFEEKVVKRVVQELIKRNMTEKAVDVGCGTGRHSFSLSRHFDTVYAFDFSPQMIIEADHDKRKKEITNIYFSVADLEYEDVRDEASFYGKVDLVLGSFGLGSFIEDTSKMLQRFYNWLKEGGYAILSFYNSNSLINQLKPNWRDTSLSAHLDIENKTLQVELSPGAVFHIYCKPFSNIVKGAISSVFPIIEDIYTYPTLMALMPNDLLQEKIAADLFKHVDDLLSNDEKFFLGHYVTVVVKKQSEEYKKSTTGQLKNIRFKGHKAIIDYLRENNCEFEILKHKPVLSMEDVIKQIGYKEKSMVKTIIFKEKTVGRLIVVALLAEKRVNKSLIAEELKCAKSRIIFASERDLVGMGFTLGGILPLGFSALDDDHAFIDKEIRKSKSQWLYMGSGDNDKTIRIKTKDFLKLTERYRPLDIN